MKKFLPVIVLGLAVVAWFSFLAISGGKYVDLKPYGVGEMETFEVFEQPKDLPETPFLNRDGESLTFADFEGKAVLVNFWATWCEPCKEEMPTLENLQKAMAGSKFEVVTISVDWQGYEVMDSFFEEYGIDNLPAYWDNSNRLPNQLETIGLPLTILIDAKGNWLGRKDGPLAWDSDESIAMMKAASRP